MAQLQRFNADDEDDRDVGQEPDFPGFAALNKRERRRPSSHTATLTRPDPLRAPEPSASRGPKFPGFDVLNARANGDAQGLEQPTLHRAPKFPGFDVLNKRYPYRAQAQAGATPQDTGGDEADFTESFGEGFGALIPQDKQALGGAGILLGQLTGWDGLTRESAELYQDAQDDLTEYDDTSFSGVLSGEDSFRDWAGHTLGNFAAQGLQSLVGAAVGAVAAGAAGSVVPGLGTVAGGAAGAIGGLVGRKALFRGMREVAENYVEKQVKQGVAREVAEDNAKALVDSAKKKKLREVAGEYAKRLSDAGVADDVAAKEVKGFLDATNKRMLRQFGGFAGAMVPNVLQEQAAAVQHRIEGGTAPEDITRGQALQAGVFGALAGGLDTAVEAANIMRFFGGKSTGNVLRRVGREVLGGATREGATEAGQAALERAGGGASLTSDEALSDYLESAAAGALGGGVFGVPAGVVRGNIGQDDQANQANQAKPGSLTDAANHIPGDDPADATAEPLDPANLWPEWIDKRTRKPTHEPTDDEIKQALTRVFDARQRGQITPSQANPSKFMAKEWGVPLSRLRSLSGRVKAERIAAAEGDTPQAPPAATPTTPEADAAASTEQPGAQADTTPAQGSLLPEAGEPEPAPPAVPWIDADTGEISEPSDTAIKAQFHRMFNAASAGGGGPAVATVNQNLADAWGVPLKRLRALRTDAMKERTDRAKRTRDGAKAQNAPAPTTDTDQTLQELDKRIRGYDTAIAKADEQLSKSQGNKRRTNIIMAEVGRMEKARAQARHERSQLAAERQAPAPEQAPAPGDSTGVQRAQQRASEDAGREPIGVQTEAPTGVARPPAPTEAPAQTPNEAPTPGTPFDDAIAGERQKREAGASDFSSDKLTRLEMQRNAALPYEAWAAEQRQVARGADERSASEHARLSAEVTALEGALANAPNDAEGRALRGRLKDARTQLSVHTPESRPSDADLDITPERHARIVARAAGQADTPQGAPATPSEGRFDIQPHGKKRVKVAGDAGAVRAALKAGGFKKRGHALKAGGVSFDATDRAAIETALAASQERRNPVKESLDAAVTVDHLDSDQLDQVGDILDRAEANRGRRMPPETNQDAAPQAQQPDPAPGDAEAVVSAEDVTKADMTRHKGRVKRARRGDKNGINEDKERAAKRTLRRARQAVFQAQDAYENAVDANDARVFDDYRELFPIAARMLDDRLADQPSTNGELRDTAPVDSGVPATTGGALSRLPGEAPVDRDAPNFGFPQHHTLPDDSPLLQSHANDRSAVRVALRNRLIDQRFHGHSPVPEGQQPRVLVKGGGGASGKGSVTSELETQGLIPDDAVVLDPDDFKTGSEKHDGLPEYLEIRAAGDSRAAAVTHAESDKVFDMALRRAMQEGYNVVVDRTMSNPRRAASEAAALKSAGYHIVHVGVTVPTHEAIARAAERAKGSPEARFVPWDQLIKAHRNYSAGGFDAVAQFADEVYLFDNFVPRGSAPVLIARGTDGDIQITNQTRYNRFKDKARSNPNADRFSELYSRLDEEGKPDAGERTEVGQGRGRRADERRAERVGRGAGERGRGKPAEGSGDRSESTGDSQAQGDRARRLSGAQDPASQSTTFSITPRGKKRIQVTGGDAQDIRTALKAGGFKKRGHALKTGGLSFDATDRTAVEQALASRTPAAAQNENRPARVQERSNNTIFTEDAAEKARQVLRRKLGQINTGVDPEILQAGITLAGYHVEKGARSFAAYTRAMVADLGEQVKPYLRSWYMGVKYDPRAAGFDGISSAQEVESTDIDEVLAATADPAPEARHADREGQGVRSQDQGGTAPVRGSGRRVSDDGLASPHSGQVGEGQPEDDGAADETGDSGRSGGGGAAADVESQRGADGGRSAVHGRERDGGAGTPDAGAGAGGAGRERLAGVPAGDRNTAVPEESLAGNDDASGRDGGRAGGRGVAGPDSPGATGATSQDFHVDDPLAVVGGGQVARFNKNQAAIELLQALEDEGRQATPEEQQVLAGYTGWGSFGQELFQGSWDSPQYTHGDKWRDRGEWLREHLGQTAWKSAQRSITNAHYTDPPTVLAMWDMVQRMGFDAGKVLEPAMGTGNFFSMMPAEAATRSQRTGIELDEVTGSIAKQLFPRSNIRVMGYEESKTPDGFYDVVIGNWPFANVKVADRRYNQLNPSLHDYFYLKTLDQVRPGGLVVGITSASTMDKVDNAIRREMAKKAELVAAIRLPSGAFEDYAGTKVVTDIVVLRKRPERLDVVNGIDELSALDGTPWLESVQVDTPSGEKVRVNNYFAEHPEHILGTLDHGHGTTTFRAGMIVHRPENMAERLREAVQLVPEQVVQPRRDTDHLDYYANETGERHGALTLVDGKLMVALGDQMVSANDKRKYRLKDKTKTAQREAQLRDAVGIRRAYADLVDAERANRDAQGARKALKAAYDAFVAEHGALRTSWAVQKYLKPIKDPFYPALAALENDDGSPAAILERSTTRAKREIANPSITDAYILARNEHANPTLEQIAERAKASVQDVRAELVGNGAIFEAPNGDIVPSDMYLGGNVREKMREAKQALEGGNKAMQRNVDALKEVVPEDVPYFNIETQLGATWVPTADYEDYVAHMLGLDDSKGIDVSFRSGRWKVRLADGMNQRPEASTNFGMSEYPFSKLVQAAISNQTLKLKTPDEKGNLFFDRLRSEQANNAATKIRDEFAAWLWSDPERRQALEQEYNDSRNAWASPRYDGSFLTFEGMALQLGSNEFNLRAHQADAIWRGIVNRKSINAHEVGTGKTFTMGGIAVESRRYGIAKKPMLLAHNANSASVAKEIQQMYPTARVLYIDNLNKKNRAVRLRQIAHDDWDVVVVPHSLIDNLALTEDTLMRMAEEDIKALENEIQAAALEDGASLKDINLDDPESTKKIRSTTAKELVKARQRIIATIQKQAQKSTRADAVSFEDLGVDMLMVDEVHEFKKPPIVTRMRMKGLNTDVSDRSIRLQQLTRYVRAMNNGGNVHTFTGTPITNTITEIFHQMRYVMEEDMDRIGVAEWDGWFNSYASGAEDVELTPAGDYQMVKRLSKFVNVPELRLLVGQYMDTVFAEDMPSMQPRETTSGKTLSDTSLTEDERAQLLNGRTEGAEDRPYKRVMNAVADMTPAQEAEFRKLQRYAQDWRDGSKKQRKEWMNEGDPRSPIITEGMANKASFDVRMLDRSLAGQEGQTEDNPNSKASRVVANVLDMYRSDPNANQVIFAEQGFNTRVPRKQTMAAGERKTVSVPQFATIRDIVERLVQGGIAREQIAIVDGKVSKEKREKIAEAMNKSDIRVVLGSTRTLGVGVNMQRNLRAMHHMDAPWMPGDLEQRNGRGQRQGNQWNTVREYRYITDRLDGRRWQILAVKQRFIDAFMKADMRTRVIEGEAAEDEQSDILESFSEAAGDPRVLQRVKLQKKLEGLQRKERLYSGGIADMQRTIRQTESRVATENDTLGKWEANDALDGVNSLVQAQRDSFRATIDGRSYSKRKDAEQALTSYIDDNLRVGSKKRKVGMYGGEPLSLAWGSLDDRPTMIVDAFGVTFGGHGLRGMETALRNFPQRVEKVTASRNKARDTIERLRDAIQQPFPQADKLESTQKQLVDLEADIQANPVAPPAWLRNGAAIDAEVYVNGKPVIVGGHRYTENGYFVLVTDDKGNRVVPYMDIKDESGMPLYEEHDFVPPVVQKNKSGDADGSSKDDGDDVVPFSARVVSTTGRKGGLNVSQVERAIDGIRASARAGLAGNGVTIEVVPDNSVFGPAGEGQQFAGGYYPQSNRIVLVASALQSPEAARKTLTHELFGHFGLNLLAPEVKQRVLRGIERTRGGKAFADLWADIERHYPDRPALEQAEEVFARLAENTPGKLRQWWNQFLANYLVPALRKAGLVSDRYTRAEMHTLADRIAQGIRGGVSQRTFADGFRGQRVGGDAAPDARLRDLVANFANAEGAPSETEITEAVQQYRAVEREHAPALRAHDEASKPLPAPNGRPTKLNREQWILTRTPNFKRWFGDWEGKARAAAIRELTPVPASDSALTAAQAKSAYRAMDTATLPNGKAVELVNSTWGKLQRHRDHDALFRVIPKLDELLRDSVLAYSEPVRAGSNKPNIEGFHNYVAKTRIGNKNYYVRFTVQEARIDRQQLHNAALSDVEIAEAGAGALHSDISKSAMPRGTSLDTRLAAWFEKINAADASKVVDANGEPLVVYHLSPVNSPETLANNIATGDKEAGQFSDLGMFLSRDDDIQVAFSKTEGMNGQGKHAFYVRGNMFAPEGMADIEGFARRFLQSDSGEQMLGYKPSRDELPSVVDQFVDELEVGDLTNIYETLENRDFVEYLSSQGYDGVDSGGNMLVFDPGTNLKSASANIGTYSDRDNINFSLPQQPRSAFRVDRAAPAAAATDAHFRKVRDIAKLATAKWGNNRPEVFVLPSPEQLPAEAKQDPRYRMANGFYDGRNIYLVAANLGQNGKVAHAVLKTLTHEAIGHYGVERVIRDYLGDGAWDKMTGDMGRMRTRVRAKTAANRQAGRKATAGLSRIEQVVADVERRYGAGTSGRTFAEETLAVLSEQGIRNHWTQQAIAAIRRWIRQYMPELRLSEAELHALLGRSSDFIHHNESYRERVDRVAASAFSRASAVETANFKRWFKNSKVVDATGKPKHVYHGTDEGFWAFDNAYLSAMTGHMTAPLGFFFTEKQTNAQAYAAKAADGVPADERVLDVYLSIQKPKPMTMAQFQAIDSFDEARALREKLQRQGFDGIHLTDFDQWVVFEPTQVKMAAENTGAFDAANPDMRYSLDGESGVRRQWMPRNAGRPVSLWKNDQPLKRNPHYKAAKAGDVEAAADLVRDVAAPLAQKTAQYGSGVTYVAPHAEEATGRNKIPQALAVYLATRHNAAFDGGIVQTNRAHHTGAKAMERIMTRAHFAGDVTPGARYVLVDDVTTMGSTLADLASYIQANGGEVVGSVVLTNASRVGTLTPEANPVRVVKRRFGDVIRNELHIEPEALTADEARYLAGFRDADAIRNRAAKARQERGERLSARGIRQEVTETPPPGGVSGSGGGNFSLPGASVAQTGEAMEHPDKQAVQRTKAWLAGKWQDIKPATLGALQMRHLLELARDRDALPAAKQLEDEIQRMDADRNQLLAGSPDAASDPANMLKRGAAPLTEEFRKWAYKGGLVSFMARGFKAQMTPEAERLMKLIHDSTEAGLDPSKDEFQRPQMEDSKGEFHADWTAQDVKDRIAIIKEQMLGRPGDDKTEMLAKIKELRALKSREAALRKQWPGLKKRWDAMSPEAQDIYRNMRDWYEQHQDAVEKTLLERIDDMQEVPDSYKRRLKERIRLQFESQRVQGVYFPLDRNGDYWVSYQDKDGQQGFEKLEGAAEWVERTKALRAKGMQILATGRQDNSYRAKDAPSGTFVSDIIGVLKDAGTSDAVQNDVYELFLKTLPEMSMRKRHIKRRKVPGYSGDALRAFAKNSFHGGHQLARLQHSQKIESIVEAMQERLDNFRKGSETEPMEVAKGDALFGEIKRRIDWILSPTDSGLANKLTSIGFMYYLGLSPASALVNLTQTAQVTLPALAAQHGWAKASKMLGEATMQTFRTGGNVHKVLKKDHEKRAYLALELRGDIDRTNSHTLAGVAEGNELTMSPAWTKTLDTVSWMFHKAEVINREATGMAAYRLARDQGKSFDQAVEYASEIINGTHFDYSNANRPRYMQSGTSKVLLQFKNYSVGMTWQWMRNAYLSLRGETPEVRRVARRTIAGMLGMTALFSGVIGLPLFNLVAMVANAAHAAFGDDDEPWDFTTEFRAWLEEHFGKGAADIIARGVADETGMRISSRVSMSHLWFRPVNRNLEGRDAYYHLLETVAGPLGGITKDMFVGTQYISEGHLWRGVERMLPTFASNGMQAFRFATQGVNTMRGDPIVPDVSATESIINALGFQPVVVGDQWRINSALMNYQEFITDRRRALLNGFAMAVFEQDAEARRAVRKKILAFNRDYPEIPITTATITRSIRGRINYSERQVHGMPINRKLLARLNEQVNPAALEE